MTADIMPEMHTTVAYRGFLREFAQTLFFPGFSGGANGHNAAFAVILITQLDALVVEVSYLSAVVAYKILGHYHGVEFAEAKKRVASQAESHP